jgi:rhodanese-related sulfurtransferase
MTEISVGELASLPNPTILDVREEDEYRAVRAEGVTLIPMSSFLDRLDEVPHDETLYIICATGVRSARVAQYLNQNGWEAVNVAGGTQAWHESGLPVEQG